MELRGIITIVVRIISCVIFIQPIIILGFALPFIKGPVPILLYAIFFVIVFLCVFIGTMSWKYGPKIFEKILSFEEKFKKS